METTSLTRMQLQAEQAAYRRLEREADEAPGKRQSPPGRDGRLTMPQDRVSLSAMALEHQPQQPSQPVTSGEKAALLGDQTVPRFSTFG